MPVKECRGRGRTCDLEIVGALCQVECAGGQVRERRVIHPVQHQEMVVVDQPHKHTDPENDLRHM